MSEAKFLIDENLSPKLVDHLASKGLAAQHVVYVGLSGCTDPEVWRYAYEHDQIVITLNVEDFLQLAGNVGLHPGLIVMRRSGLNRQEQWRELEPVIDELLRSGESMVNRIVEVNGSGQFTIRALPPEAFDAGCAVGLRGYTVGKAPKGPARPPAGERPAHGEYLGRRVPVVG